MPVLEELSMSYDYDDPIQKVEPPKSFFVNISLNKNIAKKIKNIIFTINKLNVENFYIGGGLATACFYGEKINYSDFDKRFEDLFGDIDVYISPNQFDKLLKTQLYKLYSPEILEYDCSELKRKIQFINMKNKTIETVISNYDFSINKCFVAIELYEKPALSYPRHNNSFESIEISNINLNAKTNSLDRAIKYRKRYPSITDVIIKSDKLEDLIKSIKEINSEKKIDNLIEEVIDGERKSRSLLKEKLKRFEKLEF